MEMYGVSNLLGYNFDQENFFIYRKYENFQSQNDSYRKLTTIDITINITHKYD